ncbi:cation:dicarboxylate symporter family transporter [Staphylococcus aureus]
MINKILKLAPLGVFAFICTTIITFGASASLPLLKLVLVVVFALVFFVFAILGLVAWMCGINIMNIIRILKSELLLAFSTSSFGSCTSRNDEENENFGSPKEITSFVIPIGYTFNLDGSALYQSIAALFVAQMYGMHLTLSEQIVLMLTLWITSKGMAAVPGTSIVVLLTTLGAMSLPVKGL